MAEEALDKAADAGKKVVGTGIGAVRWLGKTAWALAPFVGIGALVCFAAAPAAAAASVSSLATPTSAAGGIVYPFKAVASVFSTGGPEILNFGQGIVESASAASTTAATAVPGTVTPAATSAVSAAPTIGLPSEPSTTLQEIVASSLNPAPAPMVLGL